MVSVPLNARVLRLADVDAAICKIGKPRNTLVQREMNNSNDLRELHISFHYVRNGMNVSLGTTEFSALYMRRRSLFPLPVKRRTLQSIQSLSHYLNRLILVLLLIE